MSDYAHLRRRRLRWANQTYMQNLPKLFIIRRFTGLRRPEASDIRNYSQALQACEHV